jgi:hypothetical protein
MASNATVAPDEVHGGNMMPIIISLVVAALGLVYWRLTLSRIDPREPPEVPAKIPFIGHMVGMLTYHIDYFAMLK